MSILACVAIMPDFFGRCYDVRRAGALGVAMDAMGVLSVTVLKDKETQHGTKKCSQRTETRMIVLVGKARMRHHRQRSLALLGRETTETIGRKAMRSNLLWFSPALHFAAQALQLTQPNVVEKNNVSVGHPRKNDLLRFSGLHAFVGSRCGARVSVLQGFGFICHNIS